MHDGDFGPGCACFEKSSLKVLPGIAKAATTRTGRPRSCGLTTLIVKIIDAEFDPKLSVTQNAPRRAQRRRRSKRLRLHDVFTVPKRQNTLVERTLCRGVGGCLQQAVGHILVQEDRRRLDYAVAERAFADTLAPRSRSMLASRNRAGCSAARDGWSCRSSAGAERRRSMTDHCGRSSATT
jgi:hypothetical protein